MILPPLYPIVDADVAAAAGWTLVDLASACLAGGATILQVRAKDAPSGWLLDTAALIVERAHAALARVVVNDRADIARLADADGVPSSRDHRLDGQHHPLLQGHAGARGPVVGDLGVLVHVPADAVTDE